MTFEDKVWMITDKTRMEQEWERTVKWLNTYRNYAFIEYNAKLVLHYRVHSTVIQQNALFTRPGSKM